MPTIEEYIKAEESKMGLLDKTFNNRPTINTTKALAAGSQNTTYPDEKIIHRSAIGKVAAVALSLFICWAAFIFTRLMPDLKLPVYVPVLILMFLAAIIFIVIRHVFFNPRYQYDIKFTKEYVQVGDSAVLWKDVKETAIMSKREGKIINNWLVLFMKDDTVQKFELFKFSVSNSKLAGVVEWYKGV